MACAVLVDGRGSSLSLGVVAGQVGGSRWSGPLSLLLVAWAAVALAGPAAVEAGTERHQLRLRARRRRG